jgi:hypothetical protein
MKTSFLFCALLTFAFSVQGQGTFTYDQQSADENALKEGGLGIQSNQPIGQSFTPALSSVGFIRLYIYNTGGAIATVHVNLLASSITGNILGSSETVPISSAAASYFDFPFSTPISVTPGTTYFFRPMADSDTVGVNKGNYNYSGGSAFFTGTSSPQDLWFREGIVVPEPSSLSLIIGSGVLFYVGCKKIKMRSRTWNARSSFGTRVGNRVRALRLHPNQSRPLSHSFRRNGDADLNPN